MLPGIRVDVASAPTGSAHRVLAALRGSTEVLYAEQNGLAQIALTPNDPLFSGDASCLTAECWPYAQLHLPAAWDVTTGSSSITVAVLDSGIDASHPDLAGAVVPGYNVLADNSDTSDDNGHGTMVAGVIAARSNNGIGVAGVCGRCTILPVKIGGSDGFATFANMAKGIVYAADHGARIINISIAGPAASSALADAIRYAADKGALVVAGAGNAGSTDPTVCATGGGECGGYPAAYAPDIAVGLISVAAVNPSGSLAPYSNHGSWVLVAAPGGAETTSRDGGYTVAAGTSMATPFVAGVAGLILSEKPQLDVAELQNAITSTVTVVPGLDVADGIVNADAALRNDGSGAPPPDTSVELERMTDASPVGGAVELQATVTDRPSSGSAANVQLAIRLSPTLRFDQAWGRISGCTGAGTRITCPVGVVSPGQDRQVTIHAIVAAPGPQTISAAVSHPSKDANPADDAASVTFPPATWASPEASITNLYGGGAPVVGYELKADTSTLSGASFSYRWQLCKTAPGAANTALICTDIPGTTQMILPIRGSYVGKRLRVTATLRLGSGTVHATSPLTAPVALHSSSPRTRCRCK